MKNRTDWEQFALTGKVEDYLKYVQSAGTEEQGRQEPGAYAGFTYGDRTHTESGAHRGI